MLKLVGDDVPSIEQFMTRYRVRIDPSITEGELLHSISYRWNILRHYIG